MPWRFLVDEDTDAASAGELVDRGFDAVTVASSLGRAESDHAVAAFARSENRILVTTDREFLDPTFRRPCMGRATTMAWRTCSGVAC